MKRKITLLSGIALLATSVGFGQYCTSGMYGSGCVYGDNIGGFTLNTINNNGSGCPSGATGYSNYTSMSTTLMPGQNYAFTAYSDYGCCQYLAIYIDLNSDYDFDDAGELLYSSASTLGYATASWSGNITAPIVAGTFRLRVRGAYYGTMYAGNACTYYGYGEIEDYTVTIIPPVLTLMAEDTIVTPCYGDSVDIATTTFSGTSPYSYLWNTGDTTSSLFGVPAGSYSCIVTDDVGDHDTAYVEVVSPDSIASVLDIEQGLVCDYDISKVVVTASGGTPATGYLIDTTSANYNPDTSEVGTVITLNDDQVSGALDIGFDFVFFENTYSQFHIVSNGFITFNPSSGSGCCSGQNIPNASDPNDLIAVVWDDLYPPGAGTLSYYTTGTAPNRKLVVNYDGIPFCCSGTAALSAQAILYETTNCIEIHTEYANGVGPGTQGIENANGTEAYVYPERNASYWSNITQSYVSFCPIDSTGLIYTWSNGKSGATQYGFQPGVHSVTITDANGCEKTHEFTINAPVSALTSNLNVSDISCFGRNDGVIDPAIGGGVQDYTFVWSNGVSGTGAAFSTQSGLAPGTYSVSVEDNVNCTIEVNDIVVSQPDLLEGLVTKIGYVTCPNDTDGTAEGIAWGGVPPYTFFWLPDSITGQNITGLDDGSYQLKIIDANGCVHSEPFKIKAYGEAPVLDLGPDITLKNGGSHTLDAGNHASYQWSDGGSTRENEVTATGIYRVTVTNEDGCTAVDEIYVEVWPTGVYELAADQLRVYPNPAVAVLNIEFGATLNNATVNIVDAKGATVATVTLGNNGMQTVSVEKLPAGVYSLSVVSGATVATHRVVIAK